MAKKFDFFYLDHKIEVDQQVLTGAQIKAAIKAVVTSLDLNHELVLEGHGQGADQVVGESEQVDLDHAHGGIKKFFTRPPTSFGDSALSPVTARQFGRLQEKHLQAQIEKLPSGAALITIGEYSLPEGWNAKTTCVRFVAPVGYPGPNPDCFWATASLRLADGRMPQAANEQQIPETQLHALWFSWHIVDAQSNWNPNRDDLLTYVSIIAERFKKPQ